MKKRILLVDDDADFTDVLRITLQLDGYYEVEVQNDAAHALTTARQFEPDLIVLDVMMPEFDGTDVAATLRADPRFAHTPIVFMTALVAGADGVSTHGRGGHAYLPKQMPTDELIDYLEERLAAAEGDHVAVAMG